MLNTSQDIEEQFETEIPLEEIVSVACHYNEHTLITRGGELVQVLYTDGYTRRADKVRSSQYESRLREQVRRITAECTRGKNIALYFYVMRDKVSLRTYMPSDASQFAKRLNDAWNTYQDLDNQIANCMYIAIVHKGIQGDKWFRHVTNEVNPKISQTMKLNALANAEQELSAVTKHIYTAMIDNEVKLLTITYKNGTSISELASFFFYLLTATHRDIKVECTNMVNQITSDVYMRIQDGLICVQSPIIKSMVYMSVYTLKIPSDLRVSLINKVLQHPVRMLITESVYVTPKSFVLQPWQMTKKIYDTAKAADLSRMSGIESLLEVSTNETTRCCLQQINILIFENKLEVFRKNQLSFVSLMHELGIPMILEDVYAPSAIASHFPGNSQFLCRQRPNIIKNIGIFSGIHQDNLGNRAGSIWGPPVTIFKDLKRQLPYYFNFQDVNGIGHTMIVALDNGGAMTLSKFLMAQATKLKPKIISIDIDDSHNNSDFIRAIGGRTISITHKMDSDNELQIDLFDCGIESACDIVSILEGYILNEKMGKDDTAIATYLVTTLMETQLPDRKKVIEEFRVKYSNDSTTTAIAAIIKFFQSPMYEKCMAKEDLSIIHNNNILGIHFNDIDTDMTQYTELYSFLLLLKLSKIINDEKPSIISVNRMDFIFKFSALSRYFSKMLHTLSSNNVVVIFCLRNKEAAIQYHEIHDIINKFSNKIFISDRSMSGVYKNLFRLSEDDIVNIKAHSIEERVFLIKQGDNSVITSLDFSKISDVAKVIF